MAAIARRTFVFCIATTALASCRAANEPAAPAKPQTVTLTVEGMT